MFDKLKENAKNYIKNIAKEVVAESKPQEEPIYNYSLPEIDRNKFLGMSIQKTHADLIPDAPVGVAMDSACNNKALTNAYNITNPVNDIIYTHFATQCFIGFQACSILCQNWIINKSCFLPAQDAIGPDYDLSYVTTDEEEIDKDFLSEIKDESNDIKGFNIKKVCKIFSGKKRQFGQILAFPIVEGANYELPFNIDAIKPNTYKGMTVVDPIWYTSILDEEAVSDPTSLRYFKPTYFQMPNGKKIHHSWCIFGITDEVPDVLKATYRWGGYPLPQLMYERVYAAEKTANEAPMLAMSKRLLVADINVANYMTNPQKVTNELNTIANFRDNWGVMTKRPGDSVQQIDTSLTDLDEVIMTQYQLVAAVAKIPATKLLETQPKGFNSTGDYEDDQYKLLLTSIQEDDFRPILDFHYALLSKSKYGITRDYTINFQPIDTPTEEEQANINNVKAQTASTYVQAGVLSPDEVRDKLIKDPDSGFNDIHGEIEEEPLDFESEFGGGSETSQIPFSEDAEEWNESDHPRNEQGEFTNGGNNSSNNETNLSKYDNISYSQFEEIPISKNEKEMVRKALNTDLTAEERKKKIVVRSIRNWRYTVINNGFDDYTIIDVEDIE